MKHIADMRFRFKDNAEPFVYTRTLVKGLQNYAEDWVLAGPTLVDQFDPDLVSEFIERLSPSNMRYEVISKQFEGKTNLTAPWYQTPYNIEAVSAEKLKVGDPSHPFISYCFFFLISVAYNLSFLTYPS